MSQAKEYLGDAVYVDLDSCGWIVLTTEDGIRATNTIVMEPEVIGAFEFWLKRQREAANASHAG